MSPPKRVRHSCPTGGASSAYGQVSSPIRADVGDAPSADIGISAGSRRSTGGLSRQIDLSFRFFACTRTFEPQLPEIEPWRVDLGKAKDDPTVMISRDVRSRTGGYESAILYQECLCKPCDGAERSAGEPVRRREWQRLKAAFTSP